MPAGVRTRITGTLAVCSKVGAWSLQQLPCSVTSTEHRVQSMSIWPACVGTLKAFAVHRLSKDSRMDSACKTACGTAECAPHRLFTAGCAQGCDLQRVSSQALPAPSALIR